MKNLLRLKNYLKRLVYRPIKESKNPYLNYIEGAINLKTIQALHPCQDRLDNYIKHYKSKSFTKAQFLGLRNITQADKLWVAFRLMPEANLRLVAADIAESVLHIWTKAYPNDDRPRLAIAAARSGTKAEALEAANNVNAADAVVAADYAAHAASDAAYAAHADDASSDAAYAAHAADAASNATHAVEPKDKGKQEKLIGKIILKYWREK